MFDRLGVLDILDLYFQFTTGLLGHGPVVGQGAPVDLIPLPGRKCSLPTLGHPSTTRPLNIAAEREAAEQGTLQFREKSMSPFLLSC